MNGVKKQTFQGNSLLHYNAPPPVIIFPKGLTVEICFKTRGAVDEHSGFRVEMTEIGDFFILCLSTVGAAYVNSSSLPCPPHFIFIIQI